jgi:hypothetical protein
VHNALVFEVLQPLKRYVAYNLLAVFLSLTLTRMTADFMHCWAQLVAKLHFLLPVELSASVEKLYIYIHSVVPTAELLTRTYEPNYLTNVEFDDAVSWKLGHFALGGTEFKLRLVACRFSMTVMILLSISL